MINPRFALVAALAASIPACGGGTGGTGLTNPTPTSAVSIGVMTKGSVIVNGVHFDDTGATVVIDDTTKAPTDLQSGMVVKVLGSVNPDDVTGTAQKVKALVEVRGIPTNVNAGANPPSLVVLGQTVLADDQTIYSGLLNNFASITVNVTLIEVHGLRDSAGNIRATRIEATSAQMADASTNEIRGVVALANPATGNPTTFNLGSQAINVVNGATILPKGATFTNGSVVEVYCSVQPCVSSGAFQASIVQVEEDEDIAFQPNLGERYEVEGLVSGFAAAATTFFVGSTPVTINSSTMFEGGLVTDLANNVQVEAEGSWNGTTLLAAKIEFKRSVIRLQGATANRNPTANTFKMQIAGITTITIQLDSFTNGALPADGLTCVQVRGARQSPSSPVVVIADEIDLSCSDGGRNFIQAPVEAKMPMTSITLLNTPIDVSGLLQFQGLNGPLSPTDFFNTITVAGVDTNGISQPGTLVKVTFDPGSTVKEVEIEDEQ